MPPAEPVAHEDVDTCEDMADVASEFLEGDLDDGSATAVAAHLKLCRGCLRFYAELAVTILAMHQLGPRRG
jgi:hypothetical protein